MDVFHRGEAGGRDGAENFGQHAARTDPALQGGREDVGLLVDFLQHEVAVAALVGGIHRV